MDNNFVNNSSARLAHVDIVPSTYTSHSVAGSFSAPGLHDEFAVARGGDVIELVRLVDLQSWRVIHSEPVFGTIRAMACLPSPARATQPDCLVVTSDSGALSVLKYSPSEHRFVIESEDAFGRSGVRRTVPGHYLAVEPTRGRAIMVGALEATKLLYPVHHVTDPVTGAVKTMLLSPIEINRPATFTFALVALQDVASTSSSSSSSSANSNNMNNDISGASGSLVSRFAAIESERGLGIRQVVIYEYDGALQNCAAVLSIPVISTCPPSSLVPIPGDNKHNCPLGAIVVICSPGDEQVHTLLLRQGGGVSNEDGALMKSNQNNNNNSAVITYTQIDSCVPRRLELSPEDSPMFITGVYAQIKKAGVFTLIQNELGDLYTLTLSAVDNNNNNNTSSGGLLDTPKVIKLSVRYFDSLPMNLVAQSCILLRTGGFVVFGENGANGVYRVTSLGHTDDKYLAKQFQVKTIVKTNNNNSNSSSSASDVVTITKTVQQFVAFPQTLRHIQAVNGAVCQGGAGPTSGPTLQMNLFPNNLFSSLMTSSSSQNNNNNNNNSQQQLLQFSTKKFMSVRGKGFENSSVSLVQFGHRADVVATFQLPFAFEAAHVLPESNIFLITSRSHNATLVYSSEKFEILNFGDLAAMMTNNNNNAHNHHHHHHHDHNNNNNQVSVPQGPRTEFVCDATTLAVVELPDNGGIIQVHRRGMRHISHASLLRAKNNLLASSNNNAPPAGDSHDWAHKSGRRVQFAATNAAGQLLLSFDGGSGLMLFEYARDIGSMRIEAASDRYDGITCVAVAPPTSAGGKALLGAIGRAADKQVTFVWLVSTGGVAGGATTMMAGSTTKKSLERASNPLAFHAAPVSIAFVTMGIADTLYVVIGLEDGTVIRLPVDPLTGYISPQVLENLTEIGCGDGPAYLINNPQTVASASSKYNNNSNNNNNNNQQNSSSVGEKCCYAVSSGNIWRLSVQDRETHTQVPVSISSSSNILGGNNNAHQQQSDLTVCPIQTKKLQNGLLILNPAMNLLAAATVDTTSSYNETVLKKPSTTFAPVRVVSSQQQKNNNHLNQQQQQQQILLSSSKMIRRVMMSKDGSVGVVLENEAKSRANVVSSLTKHNTLFLGKIRQREHEAQLQNNKQNNNNNNKNNNNKNDDDDDDDDLFAPDVDKSTSSNNNKSGNTNANNEPQQQPTSVITTAMLHGALDNKSSSSADGDPYSSSWSIETFSMQKAILQDKNNNNRNNNNNSSTEDYDDALNNNNEERTSFQPSSANETATAMIVGKLRTTVNSMNHHQHQQSGYTFQNNSFNTGGANSSSVFTSQEHIVVSTIPNHNSSPSPSSSSLLYTLAFNYSGHLTLAHKTIVDGAATALHIMPQSRWLVVGSGTAITFYISGRDQLLRRHQVPDAVPNRIAAITSSEEEILCVADCHESIFLFKVGHYYQQPPQQQQQQYGNSSSITMNKMANKYGGGAAAAADTLGSNNAALIDDVNARPLAVLFADDFIPRHVTCCTFVDPSTIAVGDRFGSISVLRFNYDAVAYANTVMNSTITSIEKMGGGSGGNNSVSLDSTLALATFSSESKRLKGAAKKVMEIAKFFVGQVIVSLDRDYQITLSSTTTTTTATAASIPPTPPPLYYCTSTGKIGALIPISDDDFQHLTRVEQVLRKLSISGSPSGNEDGSSNSNSSNNSNKSMLYKPLLGRDHCSYRSSFGPVLGVVDISYIEHVWRIAKNVTNNNNDVEEIIDSLVSLAQSRNASVNLPLVGARPLETGLSELHARAIGNVEN